MLLDDILKNIAEFTNDAVLITDGAPLDAPDGPRVVYVNPAFVQMTGYAPDDIVGRTPRLLQGRQTSREVRREIRAALEAGQPTTVGLTNYRKSGEAFEVELSIRPLFEGTGPERRPRFFVAIQRDISERTARERELRAARDRAEEADRAKLRFLSHMSHELRTPLNAIIGFAEMINGQILGPIGNQRYAEYAGDIHLSAIHLLSIINDVLDFSKLDAGRVELDESEFDFGGLIDEVQRVVQGHCKRRGIELRNEASGAFTVRADERLLRQVLLNLLSNSVNFTEDGGLISVSTLRLADGRLACVINDTGQGIPSDKTIEVLEPFVSLRHEHGHKKRPGTGLGLPIAKSFMELHGGSLFINSELGAGTSVFITLPTTRVVAGPLILLGAPSGDDTPEMPGHESALLPDSAIERLSAAAIDRLPIGVMLLDGAGTVLRYNAVESRFSGIDPAAATGKNFFTDIAPCTRVSAFRRAFEAGVRDGTLNSILSYTFTFPNRPMRVLVQMKAAKEPGRGWVFVRWV
ncbi:MAG TPA: ATP-binding protein [Alphaproteobacteria bacterium]|nr:ATP-binding protein [Alphaproteobacteria bacterium]